MEIRITDSAALAIKEKLKQKGFNYGARIFVSGIG